MSDAGTCLPMLRCPGCRRRLPGNAVPFRVRSKNWRGAVADCFPVCHSCRSLLHMHRAFWEACELTAAYWWIMNRELERWQENLSEHLISSV